MEVVDLIAPWAIEHNQGFIGGFYVRCFGPFEAGAVSGGAHSHWIDHLTFIEAGAVSISWSTPDGRSGLLKRVEAPNMIEVKANAAHKITALEDGTRWRCMFAQAEAERLDQTEGPIPYMMGADGG